MTLTEDRTATLQILLVEDNPADADLVEEYLSVHDDRLVLTCTETMAATRRALSAADDPFDVVLLDLALPDSEGIDTLRTVASLLPEVPVIVLTGRKDDALASQAINEGAEDYLVKGQFVADLLRRSIHYAIERKRKSIELRERETKYRVLVENQNELVIQFDSDHRILFVSPSYVKAFGKTEEELLGREFHSLIHDDDRDAVMASLERLASPPHRTEHFERALTVKGWRWIAWSARAILDRDGSVRSIISVGRDITERKLTRDALNESEERFRNLFENAAFGIAICRLIRDGSGRAVDFEHLEVNRATETHTGFPRDRIAGKRVGDLLPAEEADAFTRLYSEALESQTPLQYERYLEIFDRTLQVGMNHLTTDMFVLTFVDISDRRNAELAVQASEEKYRLLAENTLDVIWTMDMDLVFTYVNPAITRMFGFTREEWIGSKLKEHCSAEHLSRIRRIIADSLTQGPDAPPVVLETELTDVRGKSVPVEIHGKVFYDDKGEPLKLQGTTRDISERKESETRLRQSKEILEEAQDVAGIGSWDYDVAADQPTWSREMFRIFGFDPNKREPSWEEHREVIHPEDWDALDRAIQGAVSKGRNYSHKFRIVRPDGEIVWGHTLGRVTRDETGEVVRLHGTVQDITEQVRRESERDRLQEQLIHAQKMESIGRLAGGVAHDFNNLLTAIQGFSELVIDCLNPDDPIRRDVNEIMKAADSAAALTNQLLTFSRKQIVAPRTLILNGAVERSEKMLRRVIGEDIEFRFVPGGDAGRIYIDPNQVDQILINLAVNSRDAMPDGGSLTIETASVRIDEGNCESCKESLAGDWVRLAISDTGHGMSAETIANIFEPFYTTKETGKGTGLGLSTVHGIVHQNEGHLKVVSRPGGGTSFEIYLPVSREGIESLESADPRRDLHGRESILVVEDQEIVRKLAIRTLESYGYRTLEAQNGGQALLLCEKKDVAIDLLLTDVVMPNMSGRELRDRLIEIRPGLKALFMSGYAEDTIAHHGVLDEGVDFIRKPFRPEDLCRKVRMMLDQDSKA